MNTYDELAERVSRLESGIQVGQLPLAQLRRALIENGEPLDLRTLALAATIDTEKLIDAGVTVAKLATGIVLELNVTGTARKVAFGVTVANSGVTTNVSHGLGKVPAVISLTPEGNPATNFGTLVINGRSATTFGVYQNSGLAENVHWIAIA